MKEFPKRIFVTQDQDSGEEFFLVHRFIDDIGELYEGSKVAVYELSSTHKLIIEKTLVNISKE